MLKLHTKAMFVKGVLNSISIKDSHNETSLECDGSIAPG